MNAYYKLSILALFAAYCSGSLAHAGKIYTWMDETGQTQYSDRPPIGGSYTEKHIRPGSRLNSAVGQDGLRHGELDLLRKYHSRETEIMTLRRAASKQHSDRKKDCVAARKRYSDALHNPRSMGIEYKERAKKIYHQMKEVCL